MLIPHSRTLAPRPACTAAASSSHYSSSTTHLRYPCHSNWPALHSCVPSPPPHPGLPRPAAPQVFVALILGFFTLWDLPLISRAVQSLKQVIGVL